MSSSSLHLRDNFFHISIALISLLISSTNQARSDQIVLQALVQFKLRRNKWPMPVLRGQDNRACYKHTCRIQSCLKDNHYNLNACQWAIDALKKCCEMPHAVDSMHCSFPDLKRKPSNTTTTTTADPSAPINEQKD